MAHVIITAQVEDARKWEDGFRSHGELLRSMTSTVTYFAATDKNEITLCAEPADLEAYFKVLESPSTAEAMAVDGVKRDAVKVTVLDKEFRY